MQRQVNAIQQHGAPSSKTAQGSSLPRVSLLIVDDSPYVVTSLSTLLRSIPALEIATASNGAKAVAQIQRSVPDLVLMDAEMPVMNGFEATRRLKRLAPDTTVVMMSVHDHDTVRKASVASGADQFVTKDKLHRTLLPRLKGLFPELSVWA